MTRWDTVQSAVHAWVAAASQVSAALIVFAQQNSDEDITGPWIELDLPSAEQIGLDWETRTVDLSADPGEEVTITKQGTRELELRIQAFDGPGVGATSPRSTLMNLVDRARLSSVHGLLRAAGVGLAKFSPVTVVGTVKNSSYFEPRAVVTATLYLTSEVSEKVGIIQHVDVTAVIPPGEENVDPITDNVITLISPPLE